MKMKLLGAMAATLLLVLISSPAPAQTAIAVDLNKAKLIWQWQQGVAPDDGMPTEFRMKCGPATGNYTKVTTTSNPEAREVAVKDAITGSGNWFCAVMAANEFGESPTCREWYGKAPDIGACEFVPPSRLKAPFGLQIVPQ